jgi:cytochrome c biogenesis protein CcmG/thiol:disulfide interchange protein DsbE
MQERLERASEADGGTETNSALASAAQPGRRRLLPVLAPVLIFAALAMLFMVALQKGDPSRIPSALIGRPAPAMTLPPVEGLARDGAALPGVGPADLTRGRPIVVNFWASWCLPCVEEHPQLVALAAATGVPILGINHKDQPANAARFLARHGNPFAAVGADANGRAAIEWGVYGMPETFIVDGTGKIVFKHVGPIGQEALVRQVLPALEKAGRAGK